MSQISYANWDGTQVVIKRTNGGTSNCKTHNFTAGGYEVVMCKIVGDDVHVLVKLKSHSKPTRYHIVNASGIYKGSKGM
tara:strand:- start:170 stop:406 length:237 start_codon:yes stop_codon:yes gene_type:complete